MAEAGFFAPETAPDIDTGFTLVIRERDAAAGRAATIFAGFVFAIFCGVMLPASRFYAGERAFVTGDADPAAKTLHILALLGLAFLLVRHWHRLRPILRHAVPLLVLLGLMLASMLWSQFPDATLRRFFSYLDCAIWAVYAYGILGFDRTMRVLQWVAGFVLVANLVLAALPPHFGLDVAPFAGALRGVFPQKNELGEQIVLGSTFFLYGIYAGERPRLSWFFFALTVAEVALSRSATSLVGLAAIALLTSAALLARRGPRAKAVVVYFMMLALAMVGFVALFMPDLFFAAIGKDETLTGRGPLWALAWDAAREHWLLGYGYNGFWSDNSSWTLYIWRVLGWQPPDAHNGFIEALLELGVVGLAAWLFILARVAVRALIGWLGEARPAGFWMLLLLVYYLLLNVSEAAFLRADGFAALFAFALIATGDWRARRAAPLAEPA
ncbi:MAG TPA: O-antigen ligase family protein [Stellaceae bacterium]|nr:O-antigen ligase family protein [Stellaceae bacterium]